MSLDRSRSYTCLLTNFASGGLGLTGGIADIGGLYDCLVGIYNGQADDGILEKYDEVRRERYNNLIDPISTENFKRLWDQDPDKALENDEFFKVVQRAATDKEFSKQFQKVCNFVVYHKQKNNYFRASWQLHMISRSIIPKLQHRLLQFIYENKYIRDLFLYFNFTDELACFSKNQDQLSAN